MIEILQLIAGGLIGWACIRVAGWIILDMIECVLQAIDFFRDLRR